MTILGEPLTAGMIVGFPLVLIGSVLATTRSSARAAVEPVQPTTAAAVTPG